MYTQKEKKKEGTKKEKKKKKKQGGKEKKEMKQKWNQKKTYAQGAGHVSRERPTRSHGTPRYTVVP